MRGELVLLAFLHVASFPINDLKRAMCVSKSKHTPSFSGRNHLQEYSAREILCYSSGLGALELELDALPSSRSDVSPAHRSK